MISKLIDKTIDSLFDFYQSQKEISEKIIEYIVEDHYLQDIDVEIEDFIKNNQEIPREKLGTIDYYILHNPNLTDTEKEILEALKTSYYGVFEVIEKSYDSLTLYCLLNEKTYESITPLDKRITLQNLYKHAFVYGRLLEYKGIKYFLNTYLVYKNRKAAVKEASMMIWKDPELIIKDNPDKEKEVNTFIEKIYNKFLEIFGTEVVITTGDKEKEDIVQKFYKFAKYDDVKQLKNAKKVPANDYILGSLYFDEDYDDEHPDEAEKYDIGIIADKINGLHECLSYETFRQIFIMDDYKSIPNYKECVNNFFNEGMTRNVDFPHTIIARIYNETVDKDKFLKIVRECLEDPEIADATFEEIIKKYKRVDLNAKTYDQVMMPYISKTIAEEESGIFKEHPEKESKPKIGRNDPCPCGSGKKFKKCCMVD